MPPASLLAEMLESTPDFVSIATPEGSVVYINRAGREMVGLTRDEPVAALRIEDLCPLWAFAQTARDWLPAALRDGVAAGDGALLARDGREIPVSFVLLVHRDAGGAVAHMSTIARDISDRRRIESALRESEQRFAKAFDASPLALTITSLRTGRLTEVNETFVRLSGYSRDEAVGKTTLELGLWADPGDRSAELAMIASRGSLRGLEYSFRMRDGREMLGLLSAERLDISGEPCALTVIEDITERKRAETALRVSEDRFRLAAEAVDGIIYDADVTTGTVARTRGLFEVLGYEPADVPATLDWWVAQMHPDDRLRARADAAAIDAGAQSRVQLEYRIRHRDGRWIHLMDRAVVTRDATGRVVRQVGCAQDVTHRYETERALRDTGRRKDEFLAMLAHELRNPLAPIRTAAEILKRSPLPDAVAAQARDTIERQVLHLARLVDDLLEVSRITQDKITLRRETLELMTVVGRAVETSRPLVDARRHRLTLALPQEPLQVDGDLTRLAQVLANLLNNAAKYTDEGGELVLSAERTGDEVRIAVRDNGVGIAADVLPYVFELFMQGDHSLDRSQGGLGIGLTLVRRLVELHGGRVEAHSDGPGRGSEFRVFLPLAVEAPSPLPAREPHRAAPPRARRVLVVDDNVDAAEAVATLLQLAGHHTQVAHSGPAALDQARAFQPDAVLLDIGLPGMDGYEVARRLRADPLPGRLFIVALTGYGRPDDRTAALAAGCDYHLTKPVDPGELEMLIARLVQPAPRDPRP